MPLSIRPLNSVEAARREFLDTARESIGSVFPFSNEQAVVDVEDVHYTGDLPDKKRERNTLLQGGTLGRNLWGTLVLKDAQSGKELDRQRRVLAKVPYMSDRGVFIYNGNDYAAGSQLSLRPGVYTRMTQSGEAEAPIMSEGGPGMKVRLDPETGMFRLRLQQSNLKLYPLLRAAGLDDEQLKQLWGEELLEANRSKVDSRALSRIAQKFFEDGGTENMGERLREKLAENRIDPGITRKAVGEEHDRLSPELLATIGKKLVDVAKGGKVASRDALYAQRARTPAVQLKERIGKKAHEINRYLWKAAGDGSLKRFPSGAFNPYIKELFFGTGLWEPLAEMNPLEVEDKFQRLTRTGEGGLSGHAVPEESRFIHPSHAGFIDPVRITESGSVGIDLRGSTNLSVDNDGNIYSSLVSAKTGERELVPASDLKDLVISFPGEEDKKSPFAIVGGDTQRHVNRDEVDYWIPNVNEMHASTTNLTPMLTGTGQGRVVVAGKQAYQALPLTNREAPLVRSARPDGGTYEQKLGEKVGALRSPVSGTVTQVRGNAVYLKDKKGEKHKFELYKDFPLNRKTAWTQTPRVSAGDEVSEGDLLATSNFTDEEGNLALGANLRVGFLPRGETFEDAIALSESAAKRLSAQYLKPFEPSEEAETEKAGYLSRFPSEYGRQQVQKIRENGLIEEGATVEKGDPLILSYASPAKNPYYYQLRKASPRDIDESVTWEEEFPGVVTDSVMTDEGPRVFVKAEAPAIQADKISDRFGGKGVATIIPDSEMPEDENGEPLDILFSPLAVPSRQNPAMVAEALLGKVAAERGEPIEVPATPKPGSGFMQKALEELQKAGIEPTETLYDPKRGRPIEGVLTGRKYIYRLSHTAKGKASGRSIEGYTAEGTPVKGGEGGGKRIGRQPLFALLSHGATGFIEESQKLKGSRNTELWNDLRLGRQIRMPKIPYVNRKLFDLLNAGGINVKRRGQDYHLMPLTDSDVDSWSKGEIKSSKMLRRKDMRPVTGEAGLFDPGLTGGPGGSNWTHYTLPQPVPNPVMKKPIAALLGTPQKDVRAIVAGKKKLNGKTGGQAIRDALEKIDVDSRTRFLESRLDSMSKTKRDKAVKELKYLKALKKAEVEPGQLVISRVPILPPAARPISELPQLDSPVVSDANYLYKDLIDLGNAIKGAEGKLPEPLLDEYRGKLYDGVSAVFGLGAPVSQASREKNLSGVLGKIFTSPKHSFLQRNVLGKAQELSGLSVVSPNNNLDIDHIGLPKTQAWKVYRPFVIRRLVKGGMRPKDALRHVKEQTSRAERALQDVAGKRPVIVNRAPTLHKFGMMAFWPVLTDKETLEVSPSVTSGYGMDFDGDLQYNTVILSIDISTKEGSNVLQESDLLLKEIEMPYSNARAHGRGKKYFCVHLQDFPHTDEVLGQDETRTFYGVPEGIKVIALDQDTGELVEKDVKSWSVHEDREIVTIDLASGRQIVSDDDPRAVYGMDPETMEFGRWRPEDATGKWVPRARTLPEFGTKVEGLPIESTGRLVEWLSLDREAGYFLGCMIADGWVSRSNEKLRGQINLANTSEGIQERYKAAVGRIFSDPEDPTFGYTDNAKYDSSCGESTRITVSSMELSRFLAPLIGHGVRGKHLPPCYLGAPQEFRMGLLEGLLDCDGSISISNGKKRPQLMANYTSVNLRLVQEVQHLLRSLGVSSRITASETPAGEDFWHLGISSLRLQDLGLDLRGEKKVALEEAPAPKESGISFRYDLVPVSKNLAKSIFEALDYKTHYTLYTKFSKLRKGEGNLTRHSAQKAIDALGHLDHPHWPILCRIVESEHVTWDEVEGFEETGVVETGYDLTVPGYETFMSADGIILSNTALFHVPVTDEGIADAVRIMPSNNLLNPKGGEPMYVPTKEMALGVYLGSEKPKGRSKEYATSRDAIQAYRRGEIGANQRVRLVQ